MLRSSRLLLVSALCLAAVPIAASAAPPSPDRTPTESPKASPTSPGSVVVTLARFPGFAMNFEKTQVDVVDSSAVAAPKWSARTRNRLQDSAFDHALRQTFAARDFSPDTFAGAMLDSLVAFSGPDNVIEAVRSYRPRADQYRLLLRAIRDRNPNGRTSGARSG